MGSLEDAGATWVASKEKDMMVFQVGGNGWLFDYLMLANAD
jgi:hypothetical protein